MLEALSPSDVYVLAGLVDRRRRHAAAPRQRARALGVRCARLPLSEHLPPELRGRATPVNAMMRLLVEWSGRRDWPAAIAAAFDGAAGMIHPNGRAARAPPPVAQPAPASPCPPQLRAI